MNNSAGVCDSKEPAFFLSAPQPHSTLISVPLKGASLPGVHFENPWE